MVHQCLRQITLFTFSVLIVNLSFSQYNEKYRPQFHYTASSGWIGDPAALIRKDSTYHLFTWGHAISKDLVHWQQKPFPMKGDDGSFAYFTGSAVLDKNNTAGFGINSVIAFYTMHNRKTGNQSQGLSYSSDFILFNYYKGNPVLDISSKDFRDPQVFWYSPQNKWVMVVSLAMERKVSFYASADLKNWKHLSDFGQIGAQEGVWECPDFFELSVDGKADHKKWVLSVGVGPNKQQYFNGDFDGTSFQLDAKAEAFLKKGTGMDGAVFEDFNSNKYGKKWISTGTAFGKGPIHTSSSDHLGLGHVNTYSSTHAHDSAVGTLTSSLFTIRKNAINFLISGGNHSKQTCINLIINDKVVRSTTGDNSGHLKWMGWNVSDMVGQRAQIQIVDNYTGSWGHIEVDQIMFSDILHNENREHAFWSEYGSDYYAAKLWRDYDDSSRTRWIGWMSNWEYANHVPAWGVGNSRGVVSISRELSLKRSKGGFRLNQTPVAEIKMLRKDSALFFNRQINSGVISLDEFRPTKNTYEIDASFDTNTSTTFGFNVLVGNGRKLVIGYDAKTSNLFLDRSNCSDFKSNENFNNTFPRIIYAPVTPENGQVKFHLFVDQSSIEVFTNQGKTLTALTYPGEDQTGIQVFSEGGNSKLLSFKAWMLESIWK